MITVCVSVCSHPHVRCMCKRGCSLEVCCSLEYSSPQTSFSGHQDCHGPPRGCTLLRAWPSETLLLQNNRKTHVHLLLKRNTGLALKKTYAQHKHVWVFCISFCSKCVDIPSSVIKISPLSGSMPK